MTPEQEKRIIKRLDTLENTLDDVQRHILNMWDDLRAEIGAVGHDDADVYTEDGPEFDQ